MLFEKWSEVVRRAGRKVALCDLATGNAITFSDLDRRAKSLPDPGKFWRADGDSSDFFPTIIAAWKSGKPVILKENHRRKLRSIRGEVPKGAVLIKQACGASGLERSLFFGESQLLAEARRNIEGIGLHCERPGLATVSLAHSYGFGALVLPLLLEGIPLNMLPAPLPAFLEQGLENSPPVFLPAVPALWKTWVQAAAIHSKKIEIGLCAGAPLSRELEEDLREMSGLKVQNFFGTSETGAIALGSAEKERKSEGEVGNILPGVEVQLEQDGRICVKTDARALGADADITPDEFLSDFYRTCDYGRIENGSLIVEESRGRGINVAGRKVSPDRIEAALLELDGVCDAKVQKIRSADFERFEEIEVRVRSDIELSRRDLQRSLRDQLESWEIPRHWEIENSSPDPT